MSPEPHEYHNRTIDGQRHSWRVDRLRALADTLAVTEVPLAEIFEYDTVYWFDGDHPPTVRSVVEHAQRLAAADLSDPILLSHDGWVIDGMHRIARAVLDGHATIRARRLPEYPPPDRVSPAA